MPDVRVDRESDTPLYVQIRDQIRHAIVSDRLQEGQLLLPERQLAKELGVNRTTVVNAYRLLASAGLVEGQVGRGTVVCAIGEHNEPPDQRRPMDWAQQFARQAEWPHSQLVEEAAEISEEPGVISFAGGMPAPDTFPTDAFRQACSDFLENSGAQAFLNGAPQGFYPLRDWLASWSVSQGIQAAPENILITSGATQGLDLISRALLEPDDRVLVETPSSLAALRCFNSARARVVGVPLDHDGLRLDMAENVLSRHRPKLAYVLPTFQNPTGQTWSLSRREDFLRLVERYGVAVIEDDPYSPLNYEGRPPPSLKALDSDDHVIYLSTFSKLLFPGLRLGWLVAPCAVIERLAVLKRDSDLSTNTLIQGGLWQLLSGLDWLAYLEHLRTTYRERRNAMVKALQRFGPAGLQWQTPTGGFYLWMRLPNDLSAQRLLADAREIGVAFLPGEPFCIDGSGRSSVRLNFSYASVEEIEIGIERLCGAISKLGAKRYESAASASSPRLIV